MRNETVCEKAAEKNAALKQPTDKNKKALVAMSGGVDSAVSAYLIKKAGFSATGVTMKLFDADNGIETEKSCCSLSDVEDARSVCNLLDIPYYVYNFKENFAQTVIKRFVDTYEKGGTPNPCIDCNRFLKFEKLLQRGEELGFDYVATGHYAAVEYDKAAKRYLLKKSVDLSKDQSYVLYSLTQRQLQKTLFPLGGLTKTEVRKIALELNLINAQKRESQDICFVPDGDYAAFIEQYAQKKYDSGDFCDLDGNVLGRHKGIIRYTVGQRKGLGLALPQPLYVCEKDLENNRVILGKHEDLFSKELDCGDINLISCDRIEKAMRVKARIRYNQPEQPATVYQTAEDRLHIVFDEPQRAIAKGQAAVLYDGEYVLGGGTIL